MIEKLLVAIDGSDHANKALDVACDIAKNHGAKIIVLHVVPFEPLPDAIREFARIEHVPIEEERVRFHYGLQLGDRLTAKAEERLNARGHKDVQSIVVEGDPVSGILSTAETHAVNIIVMGSRGLSDARGMMLGSVSHRVASLSGCTCVTVK